MGSCFTVMYTWYSLNQPIIPVLFYVIKNNRKLGHEKLNSDIVGNVTCPIVCWVSEVACLHVLKLLVAWLHPLNLLVVFHWNSAMCLYYCISEKIELPGCSRYLAWFASQRANSWTLPAHFLTTSAGIKHHEFHIFSFLTTSAGIKHHKFHIFTYVYFSHLCMELFINIICVKTILFPSLIIWVSYSFFL